MVAWEFRNCQTFVWLGDPLLLIECSDLTRIIARRLFTLVQRKSLLRLIFFHSFNSNHLCLSFHFSTEKFQFLCSFAVWSRRAAQCELLWSLSKIFCRLFVSSAFERRFTYTLSMHLRTFPVTQPSRFHLNTAFDFFSGNPCFLSGNSTTHSFPRFSCSLNV